MSQPTLTHPPQKELEYFSYLTQPELQVLKAFWNNLNESIYPAYHHQIDRSLDPNLERPDLKPQEREEIKRLLYERDPIHSQDDYSNELWRWFMMDDPDKMLLKFIRARKFASIFESLKMLINSLKFRIERNLDRIYLENPSILNQLAIAKAFIYGFDRSGSPIFRIKAARHKASDQTPKELEEFILYSMELTRLFVVPPAENVTLYVDLSGFGMSNMDWKCASFMIATLESYYPETLNSQIIHNAPWIFQGLWKVISTMIDPVVKSKVLFTSKNEDLLKIIDKENLLKSDGGVSDFQWKIPSDHPLADKLTKKTANGNVDDQTDQVANPLELDINLTPDQKTVRSIELGLRHKLIDHFMTLTSIWLAISLNCDPSTPPDQDSHQTLIRVLQLRDLMKLILRAQYLKLLPYIKPKTIYHFREILSNAEPGIIKLRKPNNGTSTSAADSVDRSDVSNLIVMGEHSARPVLLKTIQERMAVFRLEFLPDPTDPQPKEPIGNDHLAQIRRILTDLSNMQLE